MALLLVLLGYSVKSFKSIRRGQTQGTSSLQASVIFVSHFYCPVGHCKSSGQSQGLTQKVLHRGTDTRRTITVTIFVTHLFAEEKERNRERRNKKKGSKEEKQEERNRGRNEKWWKHKSS